MYPWYVHICMDWHYIMHELFIYTMLELIMEESLENRMPPKGGCCWGQAFDLSKNSSSVFQK